MPVRTVTFRVTLLVILIIAVLIIINACWTLWFAKEVTAVPCSGVNTTQRDALRNYNIFMLIIGIAIAIYAIVMYFIPTSEKRRIVTERYRERFAREPADEY